MRYFPARKVRRSNTAASGSGMRGLRRRRRVPLRIRVPGAGYSYTEAGVPGGDRCRDPAPGVPPRRVRPLPRRRRRSRPDRGRPVPPPARRRRADHRPLRDPATVSRLKSSTRWPRWPPARSLAVPGAGGPATPCRPTPPRSPAASADCDRITAAPWRSAASGGVVAIHAIGGMPGIGKTALAVHVAHRLRDQFPDRQLFIDLHAHTPGQEPVAPEAALAGLLPRSASTPVTCPADLAGPGQPVARPDGRPARAARPGQRRQQRPGRPAAARRRGLPGAGHQPPASGRPARGGRPGAAGRPAAGRGADDVPAAGPPRRHPAAGGRRARPPGRATCRWPSRCSPAFTPGTRPGR